MSGTVILRSGKMRSVPSIASRPDPAVSRVIERSGKSASKGCQQSVRLELPKDWAERMSDADLLEAITAAAA